MTPEILLDMTPVYCNDQVPQHKDIQLVVQTDTKEFPILKTTDTDGDTPWVARTIAGSDQNSYEKGHPFGMVHKLSEQVGIFEPRGATIALGMLEKQGLYMTTKIDFNPDRLTISPNAAYGPIEKRRKIIISRSDTYPYLRVSTNRNENGFDYIWTFDRDSYQIIPIGDKKIDIYSDFWIKIYGGRVAIIPVIMENNSGVLVTDTESLKLLLGNERGKLLLTSVLPQIPSKY